MLIYLAQRTVSPTPLINASTFPAAKYANIGVFVNLLGPLLVTGAVLIFGGMLMYGAFTILTSEGDSDQVEKARDILVWAIIGLIVVISAALIVRILGTVLDVNTLFNL